MPGQPPVRGERTLPTVLITGANRGIGLEFARSFAVDGWEVHACCRSPEKATKLKEIGGKLSTHRLDVTDGLRAASLARELSEVSVDLLVNNAGLLGPASEFGKTDFDDWVDVLKVNCLAPLRMAERFAGHVAGSGRKQIANISSVMGSIAENGGGGRYIYRSSKAALNMVTKSLSVDLAEQGVTVVSFHPGWVQTDMGGEDAAVTAKDSVAGMRRILDRLTPEQSGHFFGFEGHELPW